MIGKRTFIGMLMRQALEAMREAKAAEASLGKA